MAAAKEEQQAAKEGVGGGGGNDSAASAAGRSCTGEADAEYEGEDVVTWGSNNLVDTQEACCKACQAAAPRCNVWVYCGRAEGCNVGR